MARARVRHLAMLAALLTQSLIGCKTTPDAIERAAPREISPSDPVRKLPSILSQSVPPDGSEVRLAAHSETNLNSSTPKARNDEAERLPAPVPGGLPAAEDASESTLPIDLATALELAGANSLQVAMAREKVAQAMARVQASHVLWVPSLSAGAIYNNHFGRIQATEGDVIEVSRSSLFAGSGAALGQAPTAGGSGGPARMFVDLPLADVLFEPLAARQTMDAGQADVAVTFNNTLLEAGRAYLKLLFAESQLAIADEATRNADTLATLTSEFASAGRGLEADAQRANAEFANRQRQQHLAREGVGVASAELVRQLRLDPSVLLFPAEEQPVPMELVSGDVPLSVLIDQALASRPELGRQSALIASTWTRRQQEHFRPWMPIVFAGFSGGGFGGSQRSSIKHFSDRGDVDIGAIWEFENLGLGNRARQREADSIHQQAHIARATVADVIASEVARADRQVRSRREQIESARVQVASAVRALELNMEGIRGGVVRPIEAQQAIEALASARREYVAAIISFNEAQLELIRAVGQPPWIDSALPSSSPN